MRNSLKIWLAGAVILAPISVAAAEIDVAPVNLMGTELLQMAQAGASGGSSGTGSGSTGSSSMGSGSSSVGSGSKSGSNGLNPRVGPGSSPNPSTSPADDMAKQRDEDKRLRDKGKAKGVAP